MRFSVYALSLIGAAALSACVPATPHQIVCWNESGHPAPHGVMVDPYGRQVHANAYVTTQQLPGMVCMPIVSRRTAAPGEGDATAPVVPFGPIDAPYQSPAIAVTGRDALAFNDPENDIQGAQVPSATNPGTMNGAREGDLSNNDLANSIIDGVMDGLGMNRD